MSYNSAITRTLLWLAALVAVLLAIGVAFPGTSRAQSLDDPSLPVFDLSISSKYAFNEGNRAAWRITVDHNHLAGPEVDLSSVRVMIEVTDGAGATETTVWTIRNLQPGRSATRIVDRPRGLSGGPWSMRLYAKIVESSPAEEAPAHQYNNDTEHWGLDGNFAHRWLTNGDTAVGVGVSDRFPQPGEGTTFTVYAANIERGAQSGFTSASYDNTQVDVEVAVSLSAGLAYAETQPQAPGGTTFDPVTGIWDVGTLPVHVPGTGNFLVLRFPVAVTLSNDSLADLPLEERCLTAEVTNAVPWPSKRENDTATVCLGDEPKIPLREGDVSLFYLYDCTVAESTPCTSESTVELVVQADRNRVFLPGLDRVDEFLVKHRGRTWLQPESVIVQVRDPEGRQSDGTWHTGAQGVVHSLDAEGLSIPQDWTHFTARISVPDGVTLPGSFSLRPTTAAHVNYLDPVNQLQRGPFALTAPIGIAEQFVEFGALGTYRVVMSFDLTHKTIDADNDGNKDVFTDSGTYTFHVGPMSDLAMRDADMKSPLAAANQRAYTIVAANNGPDDAPAVEVKLSNVPEGAQAFVSGSDGKYAQGDCVDGLCEATWTIGSMPHYESSRASEGKLAFPTLTLIARTASRTPDIQVTIANTEDHTVCIDGDGNDVLPKPASQAACEATTGNSWHSTAYFDHIERNNTATIEARPGTGEGAPGQPQDLQAQIYTVPLTAALVWWTEVESVNGFPVSGYEVFIEQPENGACQAPSTDQKGERLTGTTYVDRRAKEGELTCYYVRAVNTHEVPGYWSGPVIATGESPGLPRLSVEGGGPVNEGDAAQFTVRASPAPAAGERLTFYYTVTQRGRYVAAGDLGRKETTIGNSGRATITVPTVGNDTDDADGEIFVTLNNGEGYTASSDRSASVEVRDNDNPSVSFAADPATATVSEGDGTYDVVVNLVPAPHAATTIRYQIGGVAEAGEDFTIGGLSNGFGTVTAGPGQSSVPIWVRLSDDGTSEDDEWVDIYLRAGENYDVGTPSRYTLTITDNDGPGAQFARADSEVGESDGSVGVTVNLVPAPTEDVTINYTLGGGTAQSGDYSIEGLTGSSGSVTVSAGINSVGIPVTINPDGDSERDETVVLTLGNGSDYTVGTTRTHTLTILDDDRPRAEFASAESTVVEADTTHPVTVNLRPAAPAGGLTLSYGVRSTATRNRDYRASGTVQVSEDAESVDIPVSIIHNGESEPDETVELTLRVGSGNNVGEESVHTLTITDNNLPMVAFETAEASVSETGRTHRAVITLDPAPHEDLTIGYTVDSSGTATEGVHGQHGPGDDFTIRDSGTVTVPRGQNRVVLPITILDDADAEGDETLTLTLTGGDGYALDTSANIYELTILDDDAPEVSFTAASGEPDEGAGTHVVLVRLDEQTDSPVTVGISVSPPPPNLGTDSHDHSAIPRSVTIPAGLLETEIEITITDDPDNEADEVVVLTLDPGTGYSLSQDKPTEYTLTIVDNDADENTPVASRDHPHAHGQGSTQFEVYEGHTRIPTWYVTGDFAEDVIFQYVGGTATLDEDFRLFNIDGQIEKVGDTFTVRSLESPHDSDREAGLRWARFTFDPIRDQEREGGETVILRVLNGPGYTVEEPTELTITIID